MNKTDIQHQLTHQLILHDNYFFSKKLSRICKINAQLNDQEIRKYFEYLCLQIPETNQSVNFNTWIDSQTKQYCNLIPSNKE